MEPTKRRLAKTQVWKRQAPFKKKAIEAKQFLGGSEGTANKCPAKS